MEGVYTRSFAEFEGDLYVGTNGGGLYRKSGDAPWERITEALFLEEFVGEMVVNDQALYLSVGSRDVYRYNGTTFQEIYSSSQAIALHDSLLIVNDEDDFTVFSADEGQYFDTLQALDGLEMRAAVGTDTTLYFFGRDTVLYTQDLAVWQGARLETQGEIVMDVEVWEDSVYVLTYQGGLFITDLTLTHWRQDLDGAVFGTSPIFNEMLIEEGVVYLTARGGLFRRSLSGSDWEKVAVQGRIGFTSSMRNLAGTYQGAFYAGGIDGVFVGDPNVGLHREVTGLYQTEIVGLHQEGGEILASMDYSEGVFRSVDGGNTWTLVYEGLSGSSFATFGSRRLMAHDNNILVFSDTGESWTLSNENPLTGRGIDLQIHKDTLYAGGTTGLYYSVDSGQSFISLGNQLPSQEISAYLLNDTALFVALSDGGLYQSLDRGDSWTDLAVDQKLFSLTFFNDDLIAGGQNYAYAYSLATLQGEERSTGMGGQVLDLAVFQNVLVAATWFDGVKYWDAASESWQDLYLGPFPQLYNSLLVVGDSLWAASRTYGILALPGGVFDPAAPLAQAPTFSDIQATSARVHWTPIPGAAGYQVVVEDDAGPLSGFDPPLTLTDTTLRIRSLVPRQTYTVSVASYNFGQEPVPVAATLVTADTLPLAPTILNAFQVGPTSITIRWRDNADNEEGYIIERGALGINGYRVVDTTDANAVTFTDDVIEALDGYVYRIQAYNSAGNSNYSDLSDTVRLVDLPGAPENFTAVAATPNSVRLTWSLPDALATQVVIERAVAGGEFSQVTAVAPVDTEYLDENLGAAAYEYRIAAQNVAGFSVYSPVLTARLDLGGPEAPLNLTARWRPGTGVELSWEAADDLATGFVIERGESDFILPLDSTETTDYLDTTVTGRTTSYTVAYFVYAYNLFGQSPATLVTLVITDLDAPAQAALVVYPNPAHSRLWVQLPDAGGMASPVALFSITGAKVLETHLVSGNALDVSQLPEGMYTLRVQKAGQWLSAPVSIGRR
ncbi:MAG TPA: hypothetical protein DCR93_30340 [Cytophagales bacterium]|nr:hypothetical protein [Cytophagales bacterium]